MTECLFVTKIWTTVHVIIKNTETSCLFWA